jgi:hypothetical protein
VGGLSEFPDEQAASIRAAANASQDILQFITDPLHWISQIIANPPRL